MKPKLILLCLVLLLSAVACSPDPRKDAEAYATRIEADQAALNSEQARHQDQELHAAEMQTIQSTQADRAASTAERQTMVNGLYLWGGRVLVFSICVSLLALAASISYTSIGTSRAIVRAVNVRANLIQLNRATRQFPLFIQHVHGTRYALANPNTEKVTMLDISNPSDRQMIAAMGATQLAGAIAYEAARSKDPASVAIVSPPIINAQTPDLAVGDRDVWKRTFSNLLKGSADET